MLPNRPPRLGYQVPYWDYVKLDPGQVWKGWLAGPVWGIETHHIDGTRGCRGDITGGALQCQWCKAGLETIWKGYVPLWDVNGIRCCVIVGARYAPRALECRHLEPVIVGKLKRQGSPICVSPNPWTKERPPLSAADQREQDISRWLLQIWGDVDLREWCMQHAPEQPTAESDTPMSPAVAEELKRVEEHIRKNDEFVRLSKEGKVSDSPLSPPPPTPGPRRGPRKKEG